MRPSTALTRVVCVCYSVAGWLAKRPALYSPEVSE